MDDDDIQWSPLTDDAHADPQCGDTTWLMIYHRNDNMIDNTVYDYWDMIVLDAVDDDGWWWYPMITHNDTNYDDTTTDNECYMLQHL